MSNFQNMHYDDVSTALRALVDKCKHLRKRLDENKYEYLGKKQKVYFAGPWFDGKSALFLSAIESIADMLNEYMCVEFFFPRQQQNDTPKGVYDNNIKNMEECDRMLAFISTKDVGTAFEIGYFAKSGKPIDAIGFDFTCFSSKTNLMLSYCFEKMFDVQDFLLYCLNCDPIRYIPNNEWEDKE